MADKVVDLSRTVYELCTADPGILTILVELGFADVARPGMLATAGRLMTIPKGAAMKKKDLEEIKQCFIDHGYEIKEDWE